MTFWMPVVFACLNSGSCTVVYDDPLYTEKECQKRVVPIVQLVQSQGMKPVVAACLKTDLKIV